MKILILTQYFWPENFQINDLALELKKQGHSVEVLTGKPNYPSGKFFSGYSFLRPFSETFHSIPVYRVPLLPRFTAKGWQLILNYMSFVFFACFRVLYLSQKKYDLVFVFEPSPIFQALPAILLKKLYGTHLVLWVLDIWPESLEATGAMKNPRALKIVGRVVNFIYKNCDLILASSETFIPKIRARTDRPIRHFPNWADSIFEQQVQSPNKNSEEDFIVTFAGNIGKAQSFSTILEAAHKLKDHVHIKWHVYGDGREKAWAQKKAKELGLEESVKFFGMKPLSEMPKIFSASDALLITLKKDPVFELTVPAKLQTYLACGKPIVASLDGEGADIIRKARAGYVAETENDSALAKNVLALKTLSASDRAILGENGRRFYLENYSRKMLMNRAQKLFEEVIQ